MISIEEKNSVKVPGKTSLFLTFPYKKELIDIIKNGDVAVYNKNDKTWEIPITSLQRFVDSACIFDDITIIPKGEEPVEQRTCRITEKFKSNLFDHQKEAIEYGLKNDRWLLLDDPGLGKTATTICLAQQLKKDGKVEHCLVICGVNTLKVNWKREIEKHSNLSCRILGERINKNGKLVIGSVKDRIQQLKNKIDEFFVITNVETIRSDDIVDGINNGVNKFDMIIFDEVHQAKSPTSEQGHNLLKLTKAKYKVGCTGTLLTNSPLDAYVPLKWIGEEKSNFTNFKKYYCQLGGPFGNIPVGYKNLDVLKEQIDRVSLRRTKDILNLPPKNIIREKLEMTDQQEAFYNNIKQGIVSQVDKVRMTKFTTQSVLAMVTRLRQATSCPSVLTSEKIESSKILRAVDLAQQIVDNGDKVVIFSVFKETANVLYEKLKDYKPLLNTGDISDKEIQENINKFQTDDTRKIFIGTFAKCSTGITLNKASYMICIDSCWTAALCQQAEDRIHRIGSTQPVFIYYLSCTNTIDDRVEEIVTDKGAISDYVIDDQVSAQQMESLKKYLLELQ